MVFTLSVAEFRRGWSLRADRHPFRKVQWRVPPKEERPMAKSVDDHCRDRKISLLELASKSGIALVRVQAIFMGRWTPSPDERQSIAAALEVPVDEIVWGHRTPIQHIYGHGPG
jgi:cyanate lyase